MLNLSFEETIENHRKMWNWIADETLKQKKVIKKEDYFEAHNIPICERPKHHCYTCDYRYDYDCDFCPLLWDAEYNFCLNLGSLYEKYARLTTCGSNCYEKAAELARGIANLPINEAARP